MDCRKSLDEAASGLVVPLWAALFANAMRRFLMPSPDNESFTPEDDRRQWREISELFARCLELTPQDREALLHDCQKTRPDIVPVVRGLLRDHDCNTNELTFGRPAIYATTSTGAASEPNRNPTPQSSGEQSPGALSRNLCRLFSAPASRYVFAVTNTLALAFYFFLAALIVRYGKLSVDSGWNYSPTASGWVINEVTRSGPACGKLRIGDHVLAVNGTATKSVSLPAALARLRAQTYYTLRVSREGMEYVVQIWSASSTDEHRLGRIITPLVISFFSVPPACC